MDCENLDKKSSKKQTKLAKALLRKKPLFNENEKTFQEYFDINILNWIVKILSVVIYHVVLNTEK